MPSTMKSNISTASVSTLNDDSRSEDQPFNHQKSLSLSSPTSTAGLDSEHEHNLKAFEWPKDLPKLFFPLQWKSSGNEACTIVFDSTRHLLKVVDQERSVIDVINPKDIIGVEVEIKMFDHYGPTTTRSNTTLPTYSVVSNIDDVHSKVGFDHNGVVVPGQTEIIPFNSLATAVLNIYSYPRKVTTNRSWWCTSTESSTNRKPNPHFTLGDGPRYARHYSFPVAPAHDCEALTNLVKAIRKVSFLPEKRQKYLVILNPKSGTGKARSVWSKTVQVMLEKEAGIEIVFQETQYPAHATELLRDKSDLFTFDAIVCIGGDGVLHELLNGYQCRPDFQSLLRTLRLGVVGCGTGNGLAKSLTFAAKENHSFLESTFLIARGETFWMDLSKYETSKATAYTGFLTFTWAMIADLDIDSEVIRCLGNMRLDVWAVLCVARGRSYRGRLSYLPPQSAQTQNGQEDGKIRMPPLSEPVPSTWKVIEDDIYLLWASQVSHAAEGTFHSPPSHMQDGVFQIMLLRRGNPHVGRLSIATVLLSLASGTHVTHPAVEYVECTAYRLEPLVEGSYNDLDGEIIESGPIQAQVMPHALQVFGRVS